MKKILVIIVALLFGINSYGQEEQIIKGGNYFIDNSIGSKNFSLNSSNTSLKTIDLESIKNSNYSLTVTGVEDDIVYFRFWSFKEKSKEGKEKQKKINGDNDIIYSMPLSDFRKATSIYYNRIDWKIGVFTVPFKLRFNDFDFESNINIGTNIGAKIRWDRKKENSIAIEPLLGIGLSAINLNEDNSTIEGTSSLSAFSFNGGIIIHVTDNVNIGAILGFDYLSGNDQKKYNWTHNGNGWLGLGINIAFSTGTDNSRNPGNN